MVHVLALRRVELHVIRFSGRAGSKALRFLAWARRFEAQPSPGKEGRSWLLKNREKNRSGRAAPDWKRINKSQGKPRRVPSEWLTFAGMTARRITWSPAGNGSRAGAAANSSIRRRRLLPSGGNHRYERPLSKPPPIFVRRFADRGPACFPRSGLDR